LNTLLPFPEPDLICLKSFPGAGRSVLRMETQMDIALVLIGVAWLAIAAMLLWGLADGLRKVFRTPGPLPFFTMLQRYGLTLAQLEHAVGPHALGLAVRRCASCTGRFNCGSAAVRCPNEPLFLRARGFAQP
jgi:hypothetical protein